MFIRSNSIRVGFQAWYFYSEDGYLTQLVPYAGAKSGFMSDLVFGASAFLELLIVVEQPKKTGSLL